MTRLTLNPDGPHSDAYTVEVAAGLYQCVRVLNHATYPQTGVQWPSTVYHVIGEIRGAAYGLDQLLGQLSGLLRQMPVYDDRLIDPDQTIAASCEALAKARGTALQLARELGGAHKAAGHLGLRDEP